MTNNQIQFNTVLNEKGNPIAYDITGSVTIDDEQTPLGFFQCFYFERAFNELCYWVRLCPNAQIVYTTSSL